MELSANWGLIPVGLPGLMAHTLGKNRCIQGVPDVSAMDVFRGQIKR